MSCVIVDNTSYSVIIENAKAYDDNVDENLYRLVIGRLSEIGVVVTVVDSLSLAFSIVKARNYVLSYCNLLSVPSELLLVVVDRACGEFLYVKKGSGKLECTDESVSNAVKTIQAGDTSVTFAVGSELTSSQVMDNLIQFLIRGKEGELSCYRKIKW